VPTNANFSTKTGTFNIQIQTGKCEQYLASTSLSKGILRMIFSIQCTLFWLEILYSTRAQGDNLDTNKLSYLEKFTIIVTTLLNHPILCKLLWTLSLVMGVDISSYLEMFTVIVTTFLNHPILRKLLWTLSLVMGVDISCTYFFRNNTGASDSE